jgi:subtilase family serine protease
MNPSNFKIRRLSVVVTVGLLAIAIAMFGPLSGQDARVLITGPIDETNLVTLPGNTRPEARAAENDRGPVPDSFPMAYMELQLKRPLYLQQQFDQFLIQQTTKGSPNYHQWITQEELGATYGLAQQDIGTITSWLQSKGFTIDQTLPSRMVVAFSGTAGQVRQAFHTEIHYLDVGGVQHYANMSDEQIPAALAPAVVGIVSLHDFRPHPMAKAVPQYTISSDCTLLPTQTGTCYALVPADFQVIYNINPVLRHNITGSGVVIAVVEDSDTYSTDVTTFRSTFLSKYSGTVTTVHPGTGCTDPGTNADDGEADLDAEVAGIAAPNATILVAACPSGTTFGGLIAIQNYSSYTTKPNIFSMSYGECEAVNGAAANAAFSSAYSTVQASGVAVFVSTGDGGDSQCSQNFTGGYWGIGVSGFSSTAYNVAVGGTDFEDTWNASKGSAPNNVPLSTYWASGNTGTDGSAKSYIPEIPWNESCASYLITTYVPGGYTTSYGSSGFCNNANVLNANNTSYHLYQTTGAGAGGPSGCFTGASANNQSLSNSGYGSYVSGSCAGNPKPGFQSGIFGNPADGVRDIPDVSLFASSGVWGHFATICFSDTSNGGTACTGAPSTWSGFGGTSIATPIMAGIQALINQKWGNQGNPVSTYYTIAKSEFGGSGNTSCYSINQLSESRRGLGSNCSFYDVTQGDINVDCESAGFTGASPCYDPSGTNGVNATTSVSAVYPTAGGSGYSGTPTCTIGAPPNKNSYLSPSGGTIWAGGTQATCAATVASTTTTASATANANTGSCPGAGQQIQVGATTYTFVTSSPTAVNQIYTCEYGYEEEIAADLEAAINGNGSQCWDGTGDCIYSSQPANASATATCPNCQESTNDNATLVTVTAKAAGCNGVAFWQNPASYTSVPFALSSSTGYLSGGSVSGQVCSYTVTTAGSGYTGNPSCTISGSGTGATCLAKTALGTAPSSYQPAWGATPGWDFATGIGTPNAYNLVYNTAW